MRRLLTLLLFMTAISTFGKDRPTRFEITSPDGQLHVTVMTDGQLRWTLRHGSTTVLEESPLSMTCIEGKKTMVFGRDMKASDIINDVQDTSFDTPFYKKATVSDQYHRLVLHDKKYAVEFRAYNDGAAYRFIATVGKPFIVSKEQSEYHFAGDYEAYIPYVNDNRSGERYCYSFESFYDKQHLSKMFADSLAITPLAVCLPDGKKAVVMDAGVDDYPGMMLLKGSSNSLKADFAPYALAVEIGGYDRLNLIPTERADYIARYFHKEPIHMPWRCVLVSTSDAQLLNSDMAQRLAPPCRISDTSWIKPGKVAWDWWNNTNVTGVDFASGMNTPTYKYYIDFAHANKLEYIIIDEGWSGKESLTEDLSEEINLEELIAYAKERNVGIILWTSWRNCIKDMESDFSHYADMGIKGFKVDFFDRDDQLVIQSAYEIAECAARHHLLLDYHGLKPFGIQRAYPNIVNFEGVKGLENNKWEPRDGNGPKHDFPRYDVTAPYLRMLPGPMDYTPGAMVNATRDCYFGNNDHPMSQGTRVHQMAMYTLYEAPLQMLADSPSKYMKEQECTDFIAQVPTTFDETVALGGEMGEYAMVARRKGKVWYIGILNNWTPRDVTITLSFLGSGSYKANIFSDGVNASKDATDYRHETRQVKQGEEMNIHLAPGGGWTAIIK